MGVGEYVSVSQQADMEKADVAAEAAAQAAGPESRAEEFEELVQIHIDRGLPEDLARKVAQVNTCTLTPSSIPVCRLTIRYGVLLYKGITILARI